MIRKKQILGFTLIELALVTLIISILIGLSTPLFRRTISSLALKDAAFSMSKLINYGQEKAIIDRVNYKMNFDFHAGKYWLSMMDYSVEPPVYKKVEGRFGSSRKLPQGISFTGQKDEAVFFPDGRSDEVSLKLFNVKGESYNILIKGFASRVEIEEGVVNEQK